MGRTQLLYKLIMVEKSLSCEEQCVPPFLIAEILIYIISASQTFGSGQRPATASHIWVDRGRRCHRAQPVPGPGSVQNTQLEQRRTR